MARVRVDEELARGAELAGGAVHDAEEQGAHGELVKRLEVWRVGGQFGRGVGGDERAADRYGWGERC